VIKSAFVVLVAASIVMLSFNIQAASSDFGSRDMFFMQTAPAGEIDAQGSQGVFRLMLESPSSSTITVSGKAFPVVGSQATADFVGNWNSSLYYPDEPQQAALFIASDQGKIYVMQLSDPQVGEIFSSSYISYNVTSLAFTNSTGFPVNTNQATPVQWSSGYRMGFEQATLLISAGQFVRGPDADGDMLPDSKEAALGTDPLDSDSDDDHLSDGAEVDVYSTNPLNWDTDIDDLADTAELIMHTDPHNTDTDQDTTPDGQEAGSAIRDRLRSDSADPTSQDTDGDGASDYDELNLLRTDPWYPD
jgi:hypothetical protein